MVILLELLHSRHFTQITSFLTLSVSFQYIYTFLTYIHYKQDLSIPHLYYKYLVIAEIGKDLVMKKQKQCRGTRN